MTSEMAEKSYKAVRCFYCSEPIPISARLLELFVAQSDNTTEPQCQSQAFILRCEACSKESRYLKAEIDTFEMEPPPNRRCEPIRPQSLPKIFAQSSRSIGYERFTQAGLLTPRVRCARSDFVQPGLSECGLCWRTQGEYEAIYCGAAQDRSLNNVGRMEGNDKCQTYQTKNYEKERRLS